MADPVVPIEAMPEIPNKLYFRIGEVAKLAGVKPYVLRFWESEFPGLGPKKSGTGHRLYRRKEVELVLEIKRLLYDRRFTIEGARKWLEERPKQTAQTATAKGAKAEKSTKASVEKQASLFAAGPSPEAMDQIRKELRSILEILA